MKKLYFTIFTAVLLTSLSFGQAVIFDDDFDAYIAGTALTLQTNYEELNSYLSFPPAPFFVVKCNAVPYGWPVENSITITSQHIANLVDGYFHIYSAKYGAHELYGGQVFKNDVEIDGDYWICFGDGIELHLTLQVGDVIKFVVWSDHPLNEEGCNYSSNGYGWLSMGYHRL